MPDTENANAEPFVRCDLCGEVNEDCICTPCSNCNRKTPSSCERCDRCDVCCYCFVCTACNSRSAQDGGCTICNECFDCCSCPYCDNCNERFRYSSDLCDTDYCNSCCDRYHTHGGDRMRFFQSPLTFHNANALKRKMNKSRRYIAAEIEVADLKSYALSYDVESAVRKWNGQIVADGSLPSTGFEINTAPANGDLFIEQITQICDALATAKAKVTRACGLHIHVDAKDLRFAEVRRLIRLWQMIEPAMFDMVPQTRRGSRYCMPCANRYGDSVKDGKIPYNEIRKGVTEGVYSEFSQYSARRKKSKYDGSRYYALNLHSWFHRGTVELRLPSATVKADKIIGWGRLMATIVDWAASHTDDDLIKITGQSSRETLFLVVGGDAELRSFVTERLSKYA